MDYIELNFDLHPLQPFDDILVAELSNLGFESFTNLDGRLQAYIQATSYQSELLQPILKQFEENACTVSFEEELIPSQNWNEAWESSFTPILVNEVCAVRAPFHDRPANAQFDIVIEPKMSFGTGHHATTYLMLSQLLSMRLQDKSVLDMGCGTAVLAILSERKMATRIVAIDNDPLSFENSIENCKLNDCKHVEVLLGDANLLGVDEFDLIIANINRNILIQDMPAYYKSLKDKGDLLMSGFFDVDVPLLIEHSEKIGFRLIQKLEKNTWAMLHLIK